MRRFSLRQQLIVPFVVLVIFVSTSIGWLSFRAAKDAVNTLAQRVLVDMVNRINTATERHLTGAVIALDSVAPEPKSVPVEQPFSDNLASLERRFWDASGLFITVNNYVYYGGEDGRFVGVYRIRNDTVQLFLRKPGAKEREVYAVLKPGDRTKLLRTDDYDPRVRPWYGIAAKQDKAVWSPIYNNFTKYYPTITLSKSMWRAGHKLAGVMATDITLRVLSDFLRGLTISKNGVAFVIDGKGHVVATSSDEVPFKMVNGKPALVMAGDMQSKLITESYAKVLEWRNNNKDLNTPLTGEYSAATGYGTVAVAASLLGEKYGLDWVTVVAVPNSDFMGPITSSLYKSLMIAAVCVVLALLVGLTRINRILRDIRQLTNAAKKIGNGEPVSQLRINRDDEIGQLARTFSEMEHNLRIDKLTAVFNRESLLTQIRLLKHRSDQNLLEKTRFALLFIDLDEFKHINDHYGHDAGDQFLITIAARLTTAVRATDMVARYGGDEFVVLLKDVSAISDITAAEEKIRSIVEAPMYLQQNRVNVGISIGWALFPQDGRGAEALMKIADSRMFDSKRGRKVARC